VHAIDVGHVEGRPYVALELAPGEDLRRTLAPAATPTSVTPASCVLPRARAIAIVIAACEGAAHLHDLGWVHGDLCPSDVESMEEKGETQKQLTAGTRHSGSLHNPEIGPKKLADQHDCLAPIPARP
jgi:serine/threonine protein kinase